VNLGIFICAPPSPRRKMEFVCRRSPFVDTPTRNNLKWTMHLVRLVLLFMILLQYAYNVDDTQDALDAGR